MSVQRNNARLDIQLYVEIPDETLEKFAATGWKPTAIDVLNILTVGADSPEQMVEKLRPYVYESRIKVSGGNVQRARDTHLKG